MLTHWVPVTHFPFAPVYVSTSVGLGVKSDRGAVPSSSNIEAGNIHILRVVAYISCSAKLERELCCRSRQLSLFWDTGPRHNVDTGHRHTGPVLFKQNGYCENRPRYVANCFTLISSHILMSRPPLIPPVKDKLGVLWTLNYLPTSSQIPWMVVKAVNNADFLKKKQQPIFW